MSVNFKLGTSVASGAYQFDGYSLAYDSYTIDDERSESDYKLVVASLALNQSPQAEASNLEQSCYLDVLLQKLKASQFVESSTSWSGYLFLAIPTRPGYFARSTCFEERFHGCDQVELISDRSVFMHHVKPLGADLSFEALLESSALMAVWSGTFASESEFLVTVQEIEARISFAWRVDNQISPKTLAMVNGRDNLESYLPLYESAAALGIRLVVLDQPGHFLRKESLRHLYHDFIEMDMTIDSEFSSRIVRAIKSYGVVDGICTVSDRCLPSVAHAAQILGLPTEKADSVEFAVDKYRTRCLDMGEKMATMAQDPSDMDDQLSQGRFTPRYPLIVKPSVGWSSEHVYKVNDRAELLDAVKIVCNDPHCKVKRKVLVEPYIDGPEFDVNFVLVDGKIMFFEISDDFPSAGDDGKLGEDFFENMNTLPSRLPKEEYTLVRDNLHQLLLTIGFKTGVFHLEARITNSSMAFCRDKNNAIVFEPRQLSNVRSDNPQCRLIEVNPRPPGFPCVLATRNAYGVNLFDCHLLASIGDEQRLGSLAQPFRPKYSIPNFARSWSQIVFFKAEKGGVCGSDDMCKDAIERLPVSSQKMIKDYQCFFRLGQRIPDPIAGVVSFAAFFIVCSPSSFDDALSVAHELQKAFRIPITVPDAQESSSPSDETLKA